MNVYLVDAELVSTRANEKLRSPLGVLIVIQALSSQEAIDWVEGFFTRDDLKVETSHCRFAGAYHVEG